MAAGSFEKTGEPFRIRSEPNKAGESVSEVVLDDAGVELLWRVHYGFFDTVEASRDSDGDGFTDAEEAKNWTDPLSAPTQETDQEKNPDKRRQNAIVSMRSIPPMLDGKPASPAEILTRQYQENAGLSIQMAAQTVQAAARVVAWSKRTGKSRHSIPGCVIVDVEGDRPVLLTNDGNESNVHSNIGPLWPGGSIGSDVKGATVINGNTVRKICGMWELMAPFISHVELINRITRPDNDPFNALDLRTHHATAVAGVIAATGIDPNFKGAAYEGQFFF